VKASDDARSFFLPTTFSKSSGTLRRASMASRVRPTVSIKPVTGSAGFASAGGGSAGGVPAAVGGGAGVVGAGAAAADGGVAGGRALLAGRRPLEGRRGGSAAMRGWPWNFATSSRSCWFSCCICFRTSPIWFTCGASVL
jgi:hypothetical protein